MVNKSKYGLLTGQIKFNQMVKKPDELRIFNGERPAGQTFRYKFTL